MKIFSLLLICPLLCLSQTVAERQKIVASYDQSKVTQLKTEAKLYTLEQQKLIEDYKRNNPSYKESEFHSLQRIHNGIPIFFTISNQGSSQTIRTNALYPGGSLGLNVTGSGMVAGIWDGGKVRNTHVEFNNNRVTLSDDAADFSPHATHVTGTVMAAGISPTRKGIAYAAEAFTHDWDFDFDEMVSFGNLGFLVSNHSYGYATADLPLYKFGQYDASSIEIDEVSNTFPYYQVVIAAGNDRNSGLEQEAIDGGYDLISGTGCSKNGITVSAVEEVTNYVDNFSVVMSTFSNFGPPDDGRIKPDIAAKGVNVSSPISTSNSAYANFDGTSMAAPAVTGMVLLLQQHYNNLNGNYMRAASVRGLICHTAREAGNYPGPDYEYGWGLADAQTAASVITNKGISTLMEENTLAVGQVYTKQISVSATQHLTATICWTDPVGTANGATANDQRAARLKNNLDIKVFKDGNTYYPWKLNYDEPFAAPTNDSDNNVDNVERIDIENAEPGIYTIQVSHKGANLVGGPQAYTLFASAPSGLTLATNQSDFDNNIVLYPNPAKNTINFATPNDFEIAEVTVFDVVGKQVKMNSQIHDNALDVTNLSKGIYFAKFIYQDTFVIKKFIKE